MVVLSRIIPFCVFQEIPNVFVNVTVFQISLLNTMFKCNTSKVNIMNIRRLVLQLAKNVTDRSKAVVPVLFLFCVALWFILRVGSYSKVLPCCLSSCFFIHFSIVTTLRGEEGTGLCASRALVLHVLVAVLFLFLLVLGGWLRL